MQSPRAAAPANAETAPGGETDAVPGMSPVVALVEVATGKLHAVTVTQADLNYIGSVTIDEDLLDAAGFLPHMIVQITNNATGAFWTTYIIRGARGSGIISLNGAPARHFQPGDKAFIVSHAMVEPAKLKEHWMRVVFVDDKNKITEVQKQSFRGAEIIR
jgi:aspartate 1-decarboxylase